MSDKTGKHRFNSVDFLLLMLCLGAVLTLVFRGNLARRIGLEDIGEEAEYTILLTSLEPERAALFHAGEVLTHPDTGEVLGEVRTVKRENAVVYTIDSEGQVQSASDSALYNLTLIVSGHGKQTERGFLLNGSFYASPGDLLPLSPDGTTRFAATVLPGEKSA